MAQHDYNIANQSYLNFRSDMNNAFSASISNNSGLSEPTTTVAYMNWADTTNSLHKVRNAGDNDWFAWLTTDGKHLSQDGTEALPGYSFEDDVDTGLYRPTTNALALTVGGSEAARINASGYFGVGTKTPDKLVHLEQDSSSVLSILKLKNAGTGDVAAQMSLSATDFSYGLDNSDSDRFKMGFGTELTSLSEFVIESSGFIGMGTNTPESELNGDRGLLIKDSGANSEVRLGLKNDARLWILEVDGADSDKFKLRDGTSSNDRLVVDSTGQVGIQKSDPNYILDVGVTRQTEDQGIALTPSSGSSKVLWVNTGDFTGDTATDLVTAGRGHGMFFLGQRSGSADYRNEMWAVNIEDNGTTVNATKIGSSNGAGAISSVSFSVSSGVLQVVTGNGAVDTSCFGFFQYD